MSREKKTLRGWVVVTEWDEDEPFRLGLETPDGEEIELDLGDHWALSEYIDEYVEVEGRLYVDDEDDYVVLQVEGFELCEFEEEDGLLYDEDEDLDEED